MVFTILMQLSRFTLWQSLLGRTLNRRKASRLASSAVVLGVLCSDEVGMSEDEACRSIPVPATLEDFLSEPALSVLLDDISAPFSVLS